MRKRLASRVVRKRDLRIRAWLRAATPSKSSHCLGWLTSGGFCRRKIRAILLSYQWRRAMTNYNVNACPTSGRGFYYSTAASQGCAPIYPQLTTDNPYFLSMHQSSIAISCLPLQPKILKAKALMMTEGLLILFIHN